MLHWLLVQPNFTYLSRLPSRTPNNNRFDRELYGKHKWLYICHSETIAINYNDQTLKWAGTYTVLFVYQNVIIYLHFSFGIGFSDHTLKHFLPIFVRGKQNKTYENEKHYCKELANHVIHKKVKDIIIFFAGT